jgi:hypothetical protein
MQKGDNPMKHCHWLTSIKLIQMWIQFGLLFFPVVSSSQIVRVYPQVDTLSLWGTCTPPVIMCTLSHPDQDTDRIVMHPYGADMICGVPFGNISARFDSAYFQVRDSAQCNRYEVFLANFSIYHPARYQLPFDSTVVCYSGPCLLTLRVFRNSVLVDTAFLSFGSYQTGLGVERYSSTPGETFLIQNYPNPFNPSTTIRFGVPTRSRVRLAVFNLLGQQVAELANEEMNSGSHERIWNATVASGLYFYRLEAVSLSDPNKRFVDVKKMVLLK